MKLLQQVFGLIREVVWALVDGIAQLLLAVSGSMVDMTEAQAQIAAALMLGLLVFAWVARRTIWSGGFALFRPMTVTLQTTRTPWQVLMQDLRSCLVTLLAVVVMAVLVIALVLGR